MENLHDLDTTLLQAMGAEETMMARPCCNVAELSRLRYQTARVVSQRRKIIDALYAEALAAGGGRSEEARALRSGNLDVRMRYSEHVQEWPLARAVDNWPEYRQAWASLGEVIRQQVAAERETLYPGLAFLR